jgi:pyridinium-3,5-biscarboxylic acid mononucleotide synthase
VDANRLKALLEQVRAGDVTPDAALEQIRTLPFEDLGFAKVDHHRALRMGVPEVIFGPGKSPENFVEIFDRLAGRGNTVLATRVCPEQVAATLQRFPTAEHNPVGRTLVLRDNVAGQAPEKLGKGLIGIISAGTSDIPVAEEAAVTAEVMGNDITRLFDVGVAGLHRLLSHSELLRQARVLVVCAGMEGALPSVVGGLVSVPVIAVPTSVGYGAAFGGIAALLGMINSCASNVSVVNIDNGFGAAYVASLINRI